MKKNIHKEFVDNFHGFDIPDPHRWLENLDSEETKAWVKEQNKKTQDKIHSFNGKERIENRITKLMDYPKFSLPLKIGDYYYFHYNKGLQNQPALYRSKQLNQKNKEIIIDPNTINDEGIAFLNNLAFSTDGSKLAYCISIAGSDWQRIYVKDLEKNEDYADNLKWCKFSTIAWTDDEKGFYYNRYPKQSFEGENNNNKVYYHRLGTSQNKDELIYENAEYKEFSYSPIISDDNKYIFLEVTNGTEPKKGFLYRKLNNNSAFKTLIKEREYDFNLLGNEDNIFYFYTNKNAKNGCVISIDINNPEVENWVEIIPEGNEVISRVKFINYSFIVVSMYNSHEKITIYDNNGELLDNINFSDYISVSEVSGQKKSKEMFLSYESFLHPQRFKRYNFKKKKLEDIFVDQTANESDTSKFITKQVFFPSKDGTKVSMFITHKKEMRMTGDHPTLVFGYGGYNISMTPSYSPAQKMWLEAGGIYVVVNLRGGNEYGETWHLDGILNKKQNVFDDFISASEWLIDNLYTNKRRLAIMGRSNGGLLVGAAITQRPDLYQAALCLVPVTDMLRYHKFTVGRFWTTELGNAETDEKQFRYMYNYSPLHNVQEGIEYPPTLITTGDTDDRVVPLHAYKFTAEMQKKQKGDNPILLRTDYNAGHGPGKPVGKIIKEQTDIYCFIFQHLKMTTNLLF